jgi:hypothetical protein
VDVDSVTANWTLQLHVDGQQSGLYIKPDGSELGSLTYDINEKLKATNPNANFVGKHKVELWLIAAGKPEAQVKVKGLNLFYQDEDPLEYDDWKGNYKPRDISKWTSIPSMSGKAYMKDGKVRIQKETADAAGGISSPYLNIDMDKNPILSINVAGAAPNWATMLYIQGETTGYYISMPTDKTGKFNFDIAKAIGCSVIRVKPTAAK